MQTDRNRLLAEEWLPSRFNLAIFRMLGLLVALASRRRASPALLLHHDREQHPLEPYALSCALVAVPSVHFFGAIAPGLRWPWLTWPLVILALPFVATLAWEFVVFSVVFDCCRVVSWMRIVNRRRYASISSAASFSSDNPRSSSARSFVFRPAIRFPRVP